MVVRKKLTKSVVDAVAYEGVEHIVWDTEIKGFGLRVSPKGRRSYFLKYRLKLDGLARQRKRVIGRHGQITCDQARLIAKQWCGDIAFKRDPNEESNPIDTVTFNVLSTRYLDEHARVKKKPRSLEGDESLLKRFIQPKFGTRDIRTIGREDVAALHHSLRATPCQANQVRALLSKMFNLAEAWEWRESGSNPCRHVEKFPQRPRQRYLSADELAMLSKELKKRELDEPYPVAFVRLALLTGMRRSELLALRWEDVDLRARVLHLPDSKTGPRSMPLNEAASNVLSDLPRDGGNPFIFVGRRDNHHLVGVQKFWTSVRNAVGLKGVRVHDLRHTFAAFGAGSGASLPVIGKLLGHTQSSTTARYAHLSDNPVKAASEAVGLAISTALGGRMVKNDNRTGTNESELSDGDTLDDKRVA